MEKMLSCYYLDEALNDEELRFVTQTLIGPWARFKTGASALQIRRVPLVLPTPNANGLHAHDREHRAQCVRNNLRHAGIRADCGRQVVWVMPRDADWDAVFQFAIHAETGFGPFVAQRWFKRDEALVRGPIRVVDTHTMLLGLN